MTYNNIIFFSIVITCFYVMVASPSSRDDSSRVFSQVSERSRVNDHVMEQGQQFSFFRPADALRSVLILLLEG